MVGSKEEEQSTEAAFGPVSLPVWSSNFLDHVYVIVLNFLCLSGLYGELEEGSQTRNLRLQRTDSVQGFVSLTFYFLLLVCLIFDRYLDRFSKWTWCADWDGVSLIKRRCYGSSVHSLLQEREKCRGTSVCIWVWLWIQLQFFFEGKDFQLEDHASCITDIQRIHLYLCACGGNHSGKSNDWGSCVLPHLLHKHSHMLRGKVVNSSGKTLFWWIVIKRRKNEVCDCSEKLAKLLDFHL